MTRHQSDAARSDSILGRDVRRRIVWDWAIVSRIARDQHGVCRRADGHFGFQSLAFVRGSVVDDQARGVLAVPPAFESEAVGAFPGGGPVIRVKRQADAGHTGDGSNHGANGCEDLGRELVHSPHARSPVLSDSCTVGPSAARAMPRPTRAALLELVGEAQL